MDLQVRTAAQIKEDCKNDPAGMQRLPFSCFDCGGVPTHIAHTKALHWVWACSSDECVPGAYNVELETCKDHSGALHWTLHLMEKVWFPAANFSWRQRMRERFGYFDA
jgi:hypothetical protein